MTEFFTDLHPIYQAKFDFGLAARQGIHGALIKFSEGESIRYDGSTEMVHKAEAAGMGQAAYHWLHKGDRAYAKRQVENLRRALGDLELGVVLDWEKPREGSGLGNPTIDDARWFVEEARAKAVDMKSIYLPRWYWRGYIGAPALNIPEFEGLALHNSAYGPNATGTPAAAYDVNVAAGAWTPMGGKEVTFLQFGEHIQIGGLEVDCNVYRGSEAALQRFFGAKAPASRVTRARRRIERAQTDLVATQKLLAAADATRDDVGDAAQHLNRAVHRVQKALETLPPR